jgi:hypothetical protein
VVWGGAGYVLDSRVGPITNYQSVYTFRKTQDALHFVYSCVKTHNVFLIYAGSPERFEEDYRQLAKLAEIPGFVVG